MRRIVILGNGGHSAGVAECFIGKVQPNTEVIIVPWDFMPEPDDALTFGMGPTPHKKKLLELHGQERFCSAIHPSATVSRRAVCGSAIQIMAGAIIQAKVWTGKNVLINTGAIVEHDCDVGDFAFIAPGAVLLGKAIVEENAFVGGNATVLPGRTVGKDAIVGAGAVVTNDIQPREIVAGVPARHLRWRRDDE